jgi:uncharacterized protein (DUF1330 family)
MARVAFVVVEVAGEHSNQVGLFADLAALAEKNGGSVLAHAPAGRVACLEPATVGAGLLIAKWSDWELAKSAASGPLLKHLEKSLPHGQKPTVLIAEGLPPEGLPEMMDVPTVASVPKPPMGLRNMFLLIRGSAWDQPKLDAYRDVILPMHKERGGYYESFAIAPGQVEAVSGKWTEQIFAISRWPTRASAEDFWFSQRYQTVAIPLRLGAGRFAVHALEAAT